MRVATKVTIGYDMPWRQVQAMLQMAAERTDGHGARIRRRGAADRAAGLLRRVHAAGHASSTRRRRSATLNELHGHIQDVFNEHGVQIMSPNYEADPAGPKIVPREKWFEPPAAR